MIISEHIKDYIESLNHDLTPELAELERISLQNEVPIIRRDAQELLRFTLLKEKPKAILEIGTAVGFSTLYMEQFIPADAHITTLEKVEMRLVNARKNLAGHEKITLIEGEALDSMKKLISEGKSFDFIFLDAAKGQYLCWLPYIIKLMVPGGMLITDNVMLDGTIAESKFTIERRKRSMHTRMREYLHELTHNERFETVVLPVGDGMSVSILKF